MTLMLSFVLHIHARPTCIHFSVKHNIVFDHKRNSQTIAARSIIGPMYLAVLMHPAGLNGKNREAEPI
jgi:hypothetical protein